VPNGPSPKGRALPFLNNLLGPAAGLAGQAVLGSWLGQLAKTQPMVDYLARYMYENESSKKWVKLADENRAIWRERARAALLALGDATSAGFKKVMAKVRGAAGIAGAWGPAEDT